MCNFKAIDSSIIRVLKYADLHLLKMLMCRDEYNLEHKPLMLCISGLSQENNCCSLHLDLLTTDELMGTGVKYSFGFGLSTCTSRIYAASRWKSRFWNPALHRIYGYTSIIFQNNCHRDFHDFFTMIVVLIHTSFQSFKAYAPYYPDFKDNYILNLMHWASLNYYILPTIFPHSYPKLFIVIISLLSLMFGLLLLSSN